MKMMYGNVPIKSLNIKHYEMDTNDCDMIASDLQAGKTAVARGKKIVGTGKSFEFATYGGMETNSMDYVPTIINVIQITSVDYPVKSSIALNKMENFDFSTEQTIGVVVIDNIEYPITVSIENSILTLNCDKTITLEVFLGKDNYI
jgi:hypothetical protein